MQVSTIGLDIAKNVFQVHGIDAAEKVVVRKQLRRKQMMSFFEGLAPCLVGLEACATSHHWARELTRLGHQVRLMPAKDVKAYVKRNKNDAADAEAICEAVRRPTMRFVGVKSAAQQGRLMQHRTRDLLMRQRTQTINALRAHMAEVGIVAAQGREGLKQLLAIIADERDERLPIDARASLMVLAAQFQALQTMIGSIEKRIIAQHRASETSQRVATIPGIGVLGAGAITATVTNPNAFQSGRDFAAWIGLVPRQDSTGGKTKLGPISKQGDRYLRRLLVVGAHAVLRRAKQSPQDYPWLTQLLARRPFKQLASGSSFAKHRHRPACAEFLLRATTHTIQCNISQNLCTVSHLSPVSMIRSPASFCPLRGSSVFAVVFTVAVPSRSTTMNFHRRSVLSAPLLVTAAMAPMRARAQNTHPIVGTWNLLSLYDETNGEEVDAFGPNPKGRLSLDSAQFFSLIIFTSTPLTSPRCSHSIAPMTRDALGPGTIAYYGGYTLRAPHAVSFHIEHGVTAGWKRSDREAQFYFKDNKLNLVSTFSSLTGSDYSHLQWERICG